MNAENAGMCNTFDDTVSQEYCVDQDQEGNSVLTGDGGAKRNWFDDKAFTCTELEVFLAA